ncbi:BatD family protein [Parasediminibacterium sp. JCM 36343]|uniref:BatD family protein n=1 Tax=Parasediminibacterium sp. JCM 36343 TaxID=3374279 RepID=UPI00397B77EE
MREVSGQSSVVSCQSQVGRSWTSVTLKFTGVERKLSQVGHYQYKDYAAMAKGLPPFRGWWWCCGFLFLFLSFSSIAQKASVTVSRDKIRLGETFELKLSIDPTSNAPLLIDKWFDVPDTFTHFQVVKRQTIDTIDIASTKSYKQIITLTSFDTGTYPLPVFSILLTSQKKLGTQPLPITVIPVDVSHLKDYNDIKDIIEPEPEQKFDTVKWLLVAVGVLLLVSMYFFIRKQMAKPQSRKPSPAKDFTIETALKELDALQPLIQSEEYELFFIRLADICKSFTAYQFQVQARSKTTVEYVVLLRKSVPDGNLLQHYAQLLQVADKVKFARKQPSAAECGESLAEAKKLLASIYSFHRKPANNAV